MSERAVSYTRRSTDKQEASLADQLRAIEAFAAEGGYELVGHYEDDAISGFTASKRGGFLQMVEDAAKGDWQYVVVYDVTRFSRGDVDEAGFYRHTLRRCGVEVLYAVEQFRGDESDDLLRGVKQWQAGEYLRTLSRDVMRGMLSRAEKGKLLGGRAPYGYRRTVVDGSGTVLRVLERGERKPHRDAILTLVPGPAEEVATIVRIFERFVAGEGYRKIAAGLNAEGVENSRGAAWSAQGVRCVLRNQAYVGDLVWGRRTFGKFHRVEKGAAVPRWGAERGHYALNAPEDAVVVPNAHEPLVGREMFEAAQDRLRTCRSGLRSRDALDRYVLSGLLTCGACGSPMWGGARHRPLAGGGVRCHAYYECSGERSGTALHRSFRIRADIIEPFVVGKIAEVYGDCDLRADVEALLRERGASRQGKSSDTNRALLARLAKLDAKLRKAPARILSVDDEDLAKALVAETRKLRSERQTILDQLEAARSADVTLGGDLQGQIKRVMARLGNLEATYNRASMPARKRLLRACLSSADGHDPVKLYFEATTGGTRARVKLVGGELAIEPLVSQLAVVGSSTAGQPRSSPHRSSAP